MESAPAYSTTLRLCTSPLEKGHTHVVMELIKAGADVNQATSEGSPRFTLPLKMGTMVAWPCSSKPARTFAKLTRTVTRL